MWNTYIRHQLLRAGLALALTCVLASGAAADNHAYRTTAGSATVQLNGGDSARELRTLNLQVGKSALLRTDYPVKRVSIADPEIADFVVIGSREINLVTRAVGETNVILWDRSGRAQSIIELVVGRAHGAVEAALRDVMSADDIRVQSVGDSIVLKGSVDGAADVDRAMRVAAALMPNQKEDGRIINLLEVGSNQQVMIEVTIAEMSRTFTREMEANFGIQDLAGDTGFQAFNFVENLSQVAGNALDASAGAAPSALFLNERANLIGTILDGNNKAYEFILNALKGRGLVKILAEPTLVARSGQSSNFLVGGEVPIPIAQGGGFNSITIRFKQFGVGVEFTPTVLDANRIHMEITPEVSEPDFTLGTSVAGSTVPGFRTRRASTGVELGDGQAFAIAGLLSDDVRESASQYPVLGDIPVLGTLFRSKLYQRRETELVMIVRPRLVKPLDGDRPVLPTDNFIEPSDYEFYLTNAMEGREGRSSKTADTTPSGMFGKTGHRLSIVEAEKELQ
ncbi:MAG: type II and III secretion system protein family protein [Myxococcales bacterium]|nr:type II and III secretion system protein family protein [Myxococcales bacterium]